VDAQPTSHSPVRGVASVFSVRRALLALVVVAFLFAIRVTAPREIALSDAVQDFITLSISVLIESLPFVMLGIGLSVAVQLRVGSQAVIHSRPRHHANSQLIGPFPPTGPVAGLRA
jgi:uncharacterized protein